MLSQKAAYGKDRPCDSDGCIFKNKYHVHCTLSRCHFASDDDLIINNHSSIFHHGRCLPVNTSFFHIDYPCKFSGNKCPFSLKKSHFHCHGCTEIFFQWGGHTTNTSCQFSKGNSTLSSDVCIRPFCKLKKKNHFHCRVCDQGSSSKEKLVSHMDRHGPNVSNRFQVLFPPNLPLSLINTPMFTTPQLLSPLIPMKGGQIQSSQSTGIPD